MAFTISQYNALIEAISQGADRVKYSDKEVQFMSLDNMLRLKAVMEKELGLSPGGIKTTYASFTKGLNCR